MVRKLTKEIILEAIEEEFSKIDEVGMFSGIGSAIGGMAKDLKGKFHQHRAPAVAQKLAQKYQQELSDVSGDFVGIADSFEKDYTKWQSNPFLKKMLDDLELIQSMELAAADVEQVGVKLDNAAQGNIEVSPAGEKTKANPQTQQQPKGKSKELKKWQQVLGKYATQHPKDYEKAKADPKLMKTFQARAMRTGLGTGQITPPASESLIRKIKSILKENKKIRIIKTNGQEK
tara:strand:- start:298 stop:990 length:693 start_codon:yes stop_codon:yes gene_type:complete